MRICNLIWLSIGWLGAVACDPDVAPSGSTAKPHTADAHDDVEFFRWLSFGDSIVEPGPPARLVINEGSIVALYEQTAVFPGEEVTAQMVLKGVQQRQNPQSEKLAETDATDKNTQSQLVSVTLQRHCSSERGEDATTQTVPLSGQPQNIEISHVFQEYYSCIRVTFWTRQNMEASLLVSDLSISKTHTIATTQKKR